MLNRLFPAQIDNRYRGYLSALVLFVPVVLLKLVIAFNTMNLNPWISSRRVIKSADGIPLDSYSTQAQETVVMLFADWGLAQLLFCALCILALARYRAMVPVLYLLLLIDQIGRKALANMHAIERASSSSDAGALINLALLATLLIGFALSLQDRRANSVGA